MGKSTGKTTGNTTRSNANLSTGIAILVDEDEWQALAEQNPLFEFRSYESYLVDVERRMRAAARAGRQVLVGPLMPDQFETRADAAGLPRDSPRALKDYERFVAELGPLTRPWTGEPITRILERLRSHVRAETLQARAMLALSAAAELHEAPNEAVQQAMGQAAHMLMALADGGGDGQHELRLLVSHPDGDLEYTLPYSRCGKVIAFPDDGGEHMAVLLLAIASLAERPGTMTLRSRSLPAFFPTRRKPKARSTEKLAPTSTGSDPRDSILRGWRLGGLIPQPMSEGQIFAFTCATPGGEPAAPAPGTRFRAAFPLDQEPCSTCP
jgi:hypothetical protein